MENEIESIPYHDKDSQVMFILNKPYSFTIGENKNEWLASFHYFLVRKPKDIRHIYNHSITKYKYEYLIKAIEQYENNKKFSNKMKELLSE